MEQEGAPRYRLVCTSLALSQSVSIPTYGIEMIVGERVERFLDVSVEAAEVRRLIDLLEKQRIEPCHFRDVVNDYIAFLSFP